MSSPLSPGAAVLLVARREFRTQIRSRGFAVGLLLTLVIFGIYLLVIGFVGSQVSSNTLGVTAQPVALRDALQATAAARDRTLTLTEVGRSDGERQVRDGDLDALLVGEPGSYALIGGDAVDSDLQDVVATTIRQRSLDDALVRAGLDPAQVAAQGQVAVSTLEPVDPGRGQRLVRRSSSRSCCSCR